MLFYLLVSATIAFIVYRMLFQRSSSSNIPSYRFWTIRGLQECFPRAFKPVAEKFGPICRVYFFYLFPSVLIADADLIKSVLQKRKNFTLPPFQFAAFKGLMPNSLLAIDGNDWKRHHDAMSGLFHANHVEKLTADVEKVAMQYINKWKKQVAENKAKDFDIKPDLTNMSADMVSSAVLGFNLQEVVSEEQCDKIRKAIDTVLTTLHNRMRDMLGIYKWFADPKADAAVRDLHLFLNQVIDNEMKKEHTEKNMVQSLVEQMNMGRLSRAEVIDEIMILFLAGFETTASASCNIVQAMSDYKNVSAKLQQEASDAFQRITTLSAADLDQHFAYSYQFCKEVMRFYPVAGGFGRYATEDTLLADKYMVPAGSVLLLNAFTVHHDPKHYVEPSAFKPERWTAEFDKTRHPFCYIPFGGGERQCLGRLLAMLELRVAAALFAKHFTFQVTRPTREFSRVTTSPADLYVTLTEL